MYTITEVENKFGIPASTLRFYEKEGILPKVKRDASGRRQYTEVELEWIQLVMALRNTGMSMEVIKNYIELLKLGDETLEQRRNILFTHKQDVEEKMAITLNHLEKINRKIAIYDVLTHGDKAKEYLI